jgi:hypothetical protein
MHANGMVAFPMSLLRVVMRTLIVTVTKTRTLGVTAITSANPATSSMQTLSSIAIWRGCCKCHCSSSLPFTMILILIVGQVCTQGQGPSSCQGVKVAVMFIHGGHCGLLCAGEDGCQLGADSSSFCVRRALIAQVAVRCSYGVQRVLFAHTFSQLPKKLVMFD